MQHSRRRFGLKETFPMFGLWLAAVASAGEPTPRARTSSADTSSECPVASLADLRRLSPCQLETVYASATPGSQPVGFARGEYLYKPDRKFPRLAARLTAAVWKGKHFHEDGSFINQWAGFRAIESRAQTGVSQFDGRPSMILEYPEKTPILANYRDEVREVAPGLYLAMVYERTPPHKFLGFIGMELSPHH